MERSLRDLRRFNRYLGGIAIYKRLLHRLADDARVIVDIGAGTCDLLMAVARSDRLAIGLDFKIDHLLYLRDGSPVRRVVGDANALPFRDRSVDVVTSSHFLHHFSPEENAKILGESLRIARRGIAMNDTRRHYIPLLFVHLLAALRVVGRITRFDAPASVRRGYTIDEARGFAAGVGASRWKVVRAFPFRFGILLWK
jgi:ubiquinone/menaquinone biosynthesis C-methylase UbiE